MNRYVPLVEAGVNQTVGSIWIYDSMELNLQLSLALALWAGEPAGEAPF
jgi:hypothetical protein